MHQFGGRSSSTACWRCNWVAVVAPVLGEVLEVGRQRVAGLPRALDEVRALVRAQIIDRAVARAVVLGEGAFRVGHVEGAGGSFYAPMSDLCLRRLQQASGLIAADVAKAET